MSKTPWTPGPWEVFENSIVHDLKHLDDNRTIQADWIAEIDHMNQADCDDEGYSETAHANAKLIAAAPRLADELSDIAAHLEAYDPQGDVKAWVRALADYHLPAARAALREAGREA